jgi:syndecan 1/collagen type V/XI/XXIV/XXVII alpha
MLDRFTWCCCLQGPYVLVMVALNHGSHFRLLPGVWCLRVYHLLPRAFRKNVKHVLLLQPSLMVRTGLALLYPFISSKAHAKVKQVSCKRVQCRW